MTPQLMQAIKLLQLEPDSMSRGAREEPFLERAAEEGGPAGRPCRFHEAEFTAMAAPMRLAPCRPDLTVKP